VRDPDRKKLERFAAALLGFGLQAPPGFGVFGGRPDVQVAFGFWPAPIPRAAVTAAVEVRDGERTWTGECPMAVDETLPQRRAAPSSNRVETRSAGPIRRVRLGELAYARSGDKGDHANVGVAARSPRIYEFLREWLTAARVRQHFADLVRGEVLRYELPNLQAFNFVLQNALGGGGTLSLRVDHQGKTLAQGLLLMEVEAPEGLG
jgi:hypothetical protein